MKSIIFIALLFGLISCDEITRSYPTPASVTLPASKPSNFETDDSSFLKIEIQDDEYKIIYLKDSSSLAGINALDIFLQKHKTTLNKDKIVVRGLDNNDSQKAFKDLLVKYGISKFRVDTK